MVTRRTVIQSRVVAESSDNGGGVERNVAAGAAKVLPSESLLWTHLQDEVWCLCVLLLGGSVYRTHSVHRREALLVVAKPTHCDTKKRGRNVT